MKLCKYLAYSVCVLLVFTACVTPAKSIQSTFVNESVVQNFSETTSQKEREDVLNMIRENPYITAKKVAERANISLSGANYRMRMLKKEGKICFEGKGGKGKWVVIENDL